MDLNSREQILKGGGGGLSENSIIFFVLKNSFEY